MYLRTTTRWGRCAARRRRSPGRRGAGLLLRRTRFAAVGCPLWSWDPWLRSSLDPGSWGLPGGGSNGDPCLRRAAGGDGTRGSGGRGSVTGSAVGATVRSSRPGRTADVVVVAMLVLLPAVQAAGTGNPVAYVAVNQFACWAALMVAACTMPGRRPVARRWPSRRRRARSSSRHDRCRRPAATPLPDAAWSEATTAVGGTGPMASMRVDAAHGRAVPGGPAGSRGTRRAIR